MSVRVVALCGLAAVVLLSASSRVEAEDPAPVAGEGAARVTQKYADQLQALARATLEDNRRNGADLDAAIQHVDRHSYDDLKPRLAQRDALSGPDPWLSTDGPLYGFCSEYGEALKNLGYFYFEKKSVDDLSYWRDTAQRTARKCECLVAHPAGVKEIRAHRAVLHGDLPYLELESANDRYKKYLEQCLSRHPVD